MHTQIVRGLGIRHAPIFDQPHRLKLELSCKLPPLHDSPPVPSKHLTRCLRNRVQASVPLRLEDGSLIGYFGIATKADQVPLLQFPDNLADKCGLREQVEEQPEVKSHDELRKLLRVV